MVRTFIKNSSVSKSELVVLFYYLFGIYFGEGLRDLHKFEHARFKTAYIYISINLFKCQINRLRFPQRHKVFQSRVLPAAAQMMTAFSTGYEDSAWIKVNNLESWGIEVF